MKNAITASVQVVGTEVYSLDASLDTAEFVKVSQKTVTDRIYGTLGSMSTVIPAIQTVTIRGTVANPVSTFIQNAKKDEANIKVANLEVLGINATAIKLIKGE